jgi:hypothetical protein
MPVDVVPPPPAPPAPHELRAGILTTAALANSAALLAGGTLLITIAFAYTAIPYALRVPVMDWRASVPLTAIGAVMLGWAMARFPKQVGQLEDEAEENPEPVRSTELYGIYLVGIGFALLLQAVMCSIVFAAVSSSVGQRLSLSQAAQATQTASTVQTSTVTDAGIRELAKLFGNSSEQAFFIVGLFALSTLVATLGALFFFATALWTKMAEPERDPFDRRVFWGGLWFRLGEAILFNLVFFLVLRYYADTQFLILPLVSLLVGMFLKTGESLVSGIATRVFAAIQALIPTDTGSRKEMKLLSFKLSGFGAAVTQEAKVKRVQELVPLIKAMVGVEQVEPDFDAMILRVEYNAAVVKPEDVQRKVELKGLLMVGSQGL